jgi:ADP-heptose:LPS heptosyltransferase
VSLVQSVKRTAWATIAAIERLISRSATASGRPLHEVHNFLLLQHQSALGTAIHATPLVAALRKAVPDCHIAVVASGFGTDVFRGNPNIDYLIETASPFHDLRKSARTLRRRMPFRGMDFITITSMGNERTRIALQSMLSGAALRAGFTVVPQLYRLPLAFDGTQSQIANNLRIVEALGHATTHFEPQIAYSEADLAAARDLLATGSVQPGQRIAVFITQTSATQRKSWRVERFREAAESLRSRHGMHIVFAGTSAEAAAIDALRGGLTFETANVAGKTTVRQLAALMSLCDVGLTLDTGPMHIGRAVGLPMVIIAPAWSPPVEWLPLGNDRYRILKNADMPTPSPDYIIDEVSVAEVEIALDDLVTRYPRIRS